MGGNSRISSRDDAISALSSVRDSTRSFAYSEQATRSGAGRTHGSLDPKGKTRECLDTEAMPNVTPIAFAMDVTRSRGKDAQIVHSQLLPMLGAMYLSGSVNDPQLMFAAIGDAKSDRAPLQVGQFESDDRMDADLERFWLEEGGGGTGQESYELFAYFAARRTAVDAIDKRGEKGFCFIVGDEAPYPTVSREEVKRIIGDELSEDIPTADIFAELQRRYRTYLIYPGKPMADRKDDIDAEIRQRLLKAGGRFENCSIRASLIWHTYDDLDLHVVTPNGDHIYYGHKQARCSGELDVDRNAGGAQTREPVENIRWPKGKALPGKYVVYVQNYAHHESDRKDIPFMVELDIDGKIERFEGVAKKGRTGAASNITAFEFDYLPEAAVAANNESREAYADETILGAWRQYIPDGHIIRLTDAKWTTEAAIGVMAIQNGKTLDQVVEDMRLRAVAQEAIDDVSAALRPFTGQAIVDQVGEDVFS